MGSGKFLRFRSGNSLTGTIIGNTSAVNTNSFTTPIGTVYNLDEFTSANSRILVLNNSTGDFRANTFFISTNGNIKGHIDEIQVVPSDIQFLQSTQMDLPGCAISATGKMGTTETTLDSTFSDFEVNELTRLEQGLQQSEGRFKELANLISATDVTVPAQVRKTVVQISRNLGLPISSETDPVKQIDTLLKEISALSAAEILGETGKTLSDSDRLRVDQIVGTLSFSEADPQVLITKLDRLFDVVVGNRRRDITQFRNNLQTFGNPELKGYFQQGQQSQNQNIDFDAVDKIVG